MVLISLTHTAEGASFPCSVNVNTSFHRVFSKRQFSSHLSDLGDPLLGSYSPQHNVPDAFKDSALFTLEHVTDP